MKKITICLCIVFCFILLFSFKANAQHVRGDVNLDGQVNISDVTTLIDYLLRGKWGDEPVTPGGTEYVNLGLPSGTLWATVNIGASSPEEYGSYFAWGETSAKDTYDLNNYKWSNSRNKMTKYCTSSSYGTVDDLTELDPEDDAAYVNWGGEWHMPTLEQMEELVEECYWERTTLNGVEGTLVIGSKGASLFLPAAGYQFGGSLAEVGTGGTYWSRSLYTSRSDCAHYMYFNSSGEYWDYNVFRYIGLPVRAVHDSYEEPDGDTDKDGHVNISDVTMLIDYLLSGRWSDEPVEVELEPEYVDLGLPSGTLWAKWNIGATNLNRHGSFFAWGETSPSERYDWYYYKWCKGSNNTLTKYCTNSEYGYNGFIDGKTELDPEDDAAYVNWGPSWRIPSLSQWQELYDRCTWEWTGSSQKVTGPNGNTIYLPASGYFQDFCLGNGEIGCYWTSSLYYAYNDACYFAYYWSFVKGDINPNGNRFPRCAGLKIRAVRASQN